MSKIDYQALREKAEKATWGDWDSYKPHRGARGYEVRLSSQAIAQHVLKNNAEFIAAFNPKIALALLDERERNQQYIKRRDQENEDIALTVGKLRVELEAAKKRIAELEAEPVSQTYKLNELSGNSPVIPGEVLSAILKVAKIRADFDDFDGDRRGIGDCLDEAEQELIVTINKYASQLAAEPIATNDVREQTAVPPVPVIQADVAQAIEKLKRKLVECNRYNYCADAVKGVEDACHAAMRQGSQPVSQTYNLPELIEGMEVSIDVSTCDADLGNRYFGTVTEALELDTAKNGYILLVQDAEPNFDVNGNSPVTPDGWISCSDRMPEDTKMLLAFSQGEIVAAYWNWVVNPIDYKKYRAFTYLSGNILDDVTHWMPLPEPPQEMK